MKKAFLVVLALLMCLAFAACGQKKTDNPAAETTSTGIEYVIESTTEPVTKDWNVTPIDDTPEIPFDDWNTEQVIDGGYVKLDKDGLYYVDAATNQKTLILKEDYVVYAFNGKTIVFCQRRVDPTVDFDRSYLFENEEAGGPVSAEAYEVDDVMEYDIATGKTQKLFTKYCAGGGLLYFNERAVYFEDIKESQVGYRDGYDPYNLTLYSFDRETGAREIILEGSFDARMREILGKPCIELEDGIYNISEATPVKLFDVPHGKYQWTDGTYAYSVQESYRQDESKAITLWACKISDGTEEKLKEFEATDEMYYGGTEFQGRYVLCGADITKQQNEYTVSYGATEYQVYDLLTKKTIEINPDEYDAIFNINSVLVSWIDLGDGVYQISYYDDDGNHVYYDKWKVRGELYEITPDGYSVKTGETEEGKPILSFVSNPLEFLHTR